MCDPLLVDWPWGPMASLLRDKDIQEKLPSRKTNLRKIIDSTIVGCAFPFHGEVMNRFLIGVFQGKSIETDIESICKELNERMHTHSKKAVIKAVMKIVKHYWLVKRRLQSC